jgi:hypothetical protein
MEAGRHYPWIDQPSSTKPVFLNPLHHIFRCESKEGYMVLRFVPPNGDTVLIHISYVRLLEINSGLL